MQLLIEFLPILSFFVAYKFSDVFVATGVMLVMLVVIVAWEWFRKRRVGPMLLISAGIGLIFGGLTIWLHDQTFVQWKPTVVYWLLAAVLLLGSLFTEKPLVQRLMDATLPLPDSAWRTLNTVWAVAFVVIGAVNLYVVYHYSLDTWVSFKAYGLTSLTLVFAFGQAFWLASKLPPEVAEGTAPIATEHTGPSESVPMPEPPVAHAVEVSAAVPLHTESVMNTNPSRIERIRAQLTAALHPNDLEIVDDSHLHAGHVGAREGKGHYSVRIVAADFTGLRPLARHQLVYRALADLMHTDIHALSIVALTPDELRPATQRPAT